jgi:hypothetical protein
MCFCDPLVNARASQHILGTLGSFNVLPAWEVTLICLADVHIIEEGAASEPLAVMRFLIAGTVITKLRYGFYIVSMWDQDFE